MKKLLLIGAMLIVGATSFSAVSTDLMLDLVSSGGKTTYSGTGRLPIESEGSVMDATNRTVLILTAIDSAGTDGRALTFNFGSVGRGKQEVLVGKFQAKVLDNKNPKSLSGANITVNLERGSEKGQALDFTVDSTTQTGKKLVDLTYELSKGNGLSNGGMTYDGEVIATAYRPTVKADASKEYVTGDFLDNSVNLVFNISNLTK